MMTNLAGLPQTNLAQIQLLLGRAGVSAESLTAVLSASPTLFRLVVENASATSVLLGPSGVSASRLMQILSGIPQSEMAIRLGWYQSANIRSNPAALDFLLALPAEARGPYERGLALSIIDVNQARQVAAAPAAVRQVLLEVLNRLNNPNLATNASEFSLLFQRSVVSTVDEL
jgi:hypothetical protein